MRQKLSFVIGLCSAVALLIAAIPSSFAGHDHDGHDHGKSRFGHEVHKHGKPAPRRYFNESGPAPITLPTIKLKRSKPASRNARLSGEQINALGSWSVERSIERVVHVFDLPTSATSDAYLACAGSGNLPEWGYGGAQQHFDCYRVDRLTNTAVKVPLPDDWFCGAALHDHNGDVVTTGGTTAYPVTNTEVPNTYGGSKQTYRYRSASDVIDRLGDMSVGRWYPNVFKNQVNDIFVHGGQHNGVQQPAWEVMRHGSTQWQTLPYSRPMLSYADMELIEPDTFAYTGAMGGPSGKSPFIINMKTFQVTNTLGLRDLTLRREAAALLLYPAQSERVIVAGGGSKDGLVATDKVDMIDYSGWPLKRPAFVPRAPLPVPLFSPKVVNLPNGQVFATGGSRVWRSGDVLWAGLYDPQANTWRLVRPPVYGRDYHSNVWVNTDGTVSVSGGNPKKYVFQAKIETYRPWYMDVPRPTIDLASLPTVPDGEALPNLAKGSTYRIGVTMPGDAVAGYFTLDGARASTHVSSDPGQAMFNVPFTSNGDGTVNITVPTHVKLVPGAYKLTVVTDEKVPSTSLWVKVV